MSKVQVVWGIAGLLAVAVLASSVSYYYLMIPVSGAVLFLFGMSFRIKSQFFLKSVLRTTEINVLLSFDDGPDPVNTPLVLDILKKHGVTAMFFLIGKKIAGNEALVQRIHAEGHLLGSHSYSHDPKIGFWFREKVLADIGNGHNALLKAIPNAGYWYRPPFGVTNPTIAAAINNCGLQSVAWSVRSFDTANKDPDRLLKKLKQNINGSDIVLLHDTQEHTVSILESLIVELKSRNLTLKAELN